MGRWWRYKWITFHPSLTLYCLFIFFWILVALVLWVKISWQTFVNGCIYWWCTTLEGMRDLIKSQPVYEIQYYGKTFRMNAAQVLHDKYMIWCGEQLWSAFVLATVVALVICLITFFVVSWLHTHAVVANVTQHNGEWKTLSSDKVGKTGFIENVYANQIAFGRLYREKLKEQVEALGYETEVVGKHGMWEMPGVPVEAFSGRSQTIREAVGEDASLKSRDVAALDTRKSKQHVDPEVRMAEWMQTLKETGFDIRAYRDAADQRAEIRTQTPGPASQDGPDVQQAVTQAIAGLSERKVQFTYTDVLARTVGILSPENSVIERACAGIDEAINREQLIPLEREKGLFTSGIHVLDELSVRALSRD
ncbi:conjugative relaxase, partial [Escherichia coli]|nr:conjugative relaxase [Escherichia coli]